MSTITVDNIPSELRALERWVTWHTEERQDKKTKPPRSCERQHLCRLDGPRDLVSVRRGALHGSGGSS